jgi:TDG/mug DNA glycosylase family protein
MLRRSMASCGLQMHERARRAEGEDIPAHGLPAPQSSIEHRLPDLLAPSLHLVFVGTAAGRRSAERGEYYAGRGNRFWRTLHEVRLTPRRFAPGEYRDLLVLGIGLTDMSKLGAGMDREVPRHAFDPDRFVEAVRRYRPRTIAFTGKKAASIWLGRKRTDAIAYGRQPPTLPDFPDVFVLPSTSGAARSHWSIAPWHALAVWVARRAYNTPLSASSTEMPSLSSPSSR